jgi:Predicted membrane protein (DUF2157)
MTSRTREDAQRRIDQVRAFNSELDALQRESVAALTTPQRESIDTYHARLIRELAARFDADVDERGRQLSLTMRIFSVTAAILLSTTVFLLFYHFWASIALHTQIVLLIGAPLATFAIALIMQGHDPTGYFSRLAAALCFSCFVLNIVILPTLLNLSVGAMPVLASTAFAFVLAYGMDSELLLCAGIIGIFIYSAALLAEGFGAPWWTFATRPENFLVGAAVVLGMAGIPRSSRTDFPTFYRSVGCLGFFVPLLLISAWPSLSYWQASPAHLALSYQGLTLLGSGLAIFLGVTRGWAEVTLLGAMAVLSLATEKLWIWLLPRLPVYEVFLLASAIAIAVLCAVAYLRSHRRPVGEAG